MQVYSGLPGLCAGVAWLLVLYVAPFMAGTHGVIITRSYTGTLYSECNTLARVIYLSLYLGTPPRAYRFLVCYIQSIVVDVLSLIGTLVRLGECACIVLYSLYMHTIVFCTTGFPSFFYKTISLKRRLYIWKRSMYIYCIPFLGRRCSYRKTTGIPSHYKNVLVTRLRTLRTTNLCVDKTSNKPQLRGRKYSARWWGR